MAVATRIPGHKRVGDVLEPRQDNKPSVEVYNVRSDDGTVLGVRLLGVAACISSAEVFTVGSTMPRVKVSVEFEPPVPLSARNAGRELAEIATNAAGVAEAIIDGVTSNYPVDSLQVTLTVDGSDFIPPED